MIEKNYRNIIKNPKERGITLITLTVAVSILIIISSMLIYNAKNGLKMRDLSMMENDIEQLDDAINSYYLKYGALPIEHQYTNIKFTPEPNDIQEYYVIDLSALEGITLNYGKQYHEIDEYTTEDEMKEIDDLYIMDKESHHIYYAKGILVDNVIYYTNTSDDEIEIVEIPTGINVSLSKDTNDNQWGNEVKLIGTAEVKESSKGEITIEGYVFNTISDEDSLIDVTWAEATDENSITAETTVTENGKYYFWVIDNEGEYHRSNPVEITNIDNNKPEVGDFAGAEREIGQDTDGDEYTFGEDTDKNVHIYVTDKGKDAETAEEDLEVVITVTKQGIDGIYKEGTDLVIEDEGRYTVTMVTIDQAGNESDSLIKTVIIDRAVPVLALKHNDENGADYIPGTWTKDDLYGEITIDTSATGKTVEKYQYLYSNGTTWKDISDTPVVERIDYTATFPMGEDRPNWISGPINNGEYYFEIQENGTLKPNNSGINSKIANSYFEIDLTQYPEATLELTINATISSENNYDFGYAEITEDTTAPSFNKNNTYYIKVSGSTTTADHTTTLAGGSKYYLHIGYSKDSSSASNQDTFIINSITLKSEQLGKGLNFYEYERNDNTVTFTLKDDIEKSIYVGAVYENEVQPKKKVGPTTIMIDKTAPVIESTDAVITSKTEARVNVVVKEDGSGLQGYYLSTEDITPTEQSIWTEQILKEFSIEGLSTETTYYLWVKDKVGNISGKQEIVVGTANYVIDDETYTETLNQALSHENTKDGSTIKLLNDYTDISSVIFNKSVTLDVQAYTLTRNATITINSGKTVEITGTGKMTTKANSVRTITNNGTLTISNSIIIENMSTSTSNAPIYSNNNNAVTNINDNVQIIGYYRGIYNNKGIINVNGGYIEATYANSSAYGIYNYSSSSKTYINAGEIKGYYGIYNYNNSAILEMTGGKVVGTGAYGIYARGTTNIYGGRIEGKTFGIYGYATDKITIGKQEDNLSTTNPAIYGETYAIYMSNETYSFNFYNGVLISNTKETAYNSAVNLREGHMPYTYLDYEVEQRYCTILVPIVENIIMEATPTEYTNGDVTVKITYPYVEGTRQYSEDGIEWEDTNYFNEEIITSENKTIYARTLNESGMITDEEQIVINNIDKEKPVITVSPTETNYIVIEENDTVDINLTIKAADTGVSGLNVMQYGWAKEGEEVTYVDFTNEITINKTNLEIGQYNLYLKVTDKAGNEAELKQMRYNVKYQEPVCKIGTTKYLTIQEAIEACSKEAGDAQTTIEILKSTDEEFNTYQGQNIILDLKGYTVGSSSQERTICTNNAILQIIDTSTEKTGQIESLNAIAIINTSTGILTIGDNSTSIENEVPTIYGKNIGIKNDGTFDFYDGKIQGTTPISGKVTNTPEEYGPVSTEYNNGITTVQLGIITGYEARIEWVYYTKLQEAIDATKYNKKETVTIIKNIQLQEIVETKAAKNMILDLDIYELTIIPGKDRVLNNYGDLEITQSNIEQGKGIYIESTDNCYGIYNIGNIIIKKATINSSSINKGDRHSYGIYNASSGTIIIEDGTVSSSSSSTNNVSSNSYGIYNENSGAVIINGGKISSESNNMAGKFGYGIYNESNGSVEVTGGTINGRGYGIYNNGSGNIEVTEGTIESNRYGIYNASAGRIRITGGMISSGQNGIYNIDIGSVEVTGGTIESKRYGICNTSNGNVEVTGGTIISGSIEYNDYIAYGIYNSSTGSIIIGSNREKLVSKENPYIKGVYKGTSQKEEYGIYNLNGKLEFYSGKIEGNTAIIGIITGKREGYEIVKEANEDTEVIYLKEKIEEDVVQIDEIKYKSLQEAIDSIGDNEEKTIEVIKEFEINEPIIFNKQTIMNLNGYTITNNYWRIENNKELKIIDTTENNEGKLNIVNTIYGVVNNGKMIIKEGTISNISNYDCYGIYNNGSITVGGGIVSSYSSNNKNSNNKSYGIYNKSGGSITIEAGTISSKCHTNQNPYGIYNIGNGNIVKVIGGIIDALYGIYHYSDGNVEISGGTISNCDYGIYNYSNGNVEMNGGTISNCKVGMYNYNNGCIIMKGGIINSSKGNYNYGIHNASTGRIEVIGGMITSSNNYNSNSYAIYNSSTGNIIVGIKGDGLISQEEPYIKGEYTGTSTKYAGYGIYNTKGTFYFYDGKIEGTTKAVYDIITEIEENTELNYNEDETILILSSEIGDIAQIGEITYKTIQEAINAIGSEQTTIKLLRNVTYTNQDIVITVPNNKNIILDLNGYKITSSIPEKLLQNEGILEIIDTSEEKTGILVTSEETTINNMEHAKLIITGGIVENRTKQSILNNGELIIQGGNIISKHINYGTGYSIYNESTGTIKVISGTINSDNSNYGTCYGIYNVSTGRLIVEGGIITTVGSGYGYGIYNHSTGSIEITGGTINANNGEYAYGIYNHSTGSIEITGGTIIYSSRYGIYNNSTGMITIGTKGNQLVSQEELYIKGGNTGTITSYTRYGVYNLKGKLYYYDGKIEGFTRSIKGIITEIENMTELLITKDTSEIIQLQEKETNVANVNGVEYDSIQEAILACGTTESTIKILRDTDPGATIVIEDGQNITIDLNGYTVNNYPEITNKGTLKITDTSTTQTGKLIGLIGTVVLNEGTMELNGGSITDTGYGINNKGVLTVNGGNITNNTYGIYNDSNGIITISSGMIMSNNYGIYNNSGTINITSDIGNNTYGVYVYSGSVNINSKIAESTYNVYNNLGRVDITGNIAGGNYGIYNIKGTTNIKEGSQISSTTGIYNSNGTINIGETGTMNSSSPVIIGEQYGLTNETSATVNMYDGQIKGKTGATQGYITNTETGYAVGTKIEGEYMVDYLALAGTISTVAQVNGIDFSNLQSAINSVIGEEKQTITLTNGLKTEIQLNIAEGQNIILDMNGKTITSDLNVTITNNGNLTIIDTSGKNVGKISSTVGTAIVNTGTLTLGQDDGTVVQDLINIDGTTIGIENSGTLNFYDGTINGASAVSGTITSRATGYVIRTTTVDSKERYYLTI